MSGYNGGTGRSTYGTSGSYDFPMAAAPVPAIEEDIFAAALEVVIACNDRSMASSVTIPCETLMLLIDALDKSLWTVRMKDIHAFMKEKGWTTSGFKSEPDVTAISTKLKSLYNM